MHCFLEMHLQILWQLNSKMSQQDLTGGKTHPLWIHEKSDRYAPRRPRCLKVADFCWQKKEKHSGNLNLVLGEFHLMCHMTKHMGRQSLRMRLTQVEEY